MILCVFLKYSWTFLSFWNLARTRAGYFLLHAKFPPCQIMFKKLGKTLGHAGFPVNAQVLILQGVNILNSFSPPPKIIIEELFTQWDWYIHTTFWKIKRSGMQRNFNKSVKTFSTNTVTCKCGKIYIYLSLSLYIYERGRDIYIKREIYIYVYIEREIKYGCEINHTMIMSSRKICGVDAICIQMT